MPRRLAASALLAFACASPPPPLPPCAPSTAGVPLAFELHAPNGHSAFLQGSVHVAREAEAGLHPRAHRALAEADVLVGEVDMASITPEEMAQEMLTRGQLPQDKHLQEVISAETWDLVQQRAAESGLPLEPFEQMKPWVLALTFIGLSLGQAGFTPEQGVEMQVYSAERPQASRGLETVSEQFALFDSMPYEAQEHMLRDTLQPTEKTGLELEAMFAAWRCGDAPALEGVLEGMVAADPTLVPFYEVTVFQRNKSMAEGVVDVIRESERAFIVVGALHLVGARGIPALLEKEGFRVEQVRAAQPAASP